MRQHFGGELAVAGITGVAGPVDSVTGVALTAGSVVILVAFALVIGAAGFWVGRRTRTTPVMSAGPDRLLVQGLIGSYDLAHDEAQQGHVEQVLRRAGVVAVRPAPDSRPADDRCEVVGTAPAPSPQHVGAVAELVRAGWAMGTDLVRPAQVIVYADARDDPDR